MDQHSISDRVKRAGRAPVNGAEGSRKQATRRRAEEPAHLGWGIVLIVCALLYRPLGFWANNAWDLASPQEILLPVLVVAAVVSVLLFSISRVTHRPFEAAILLSWAVFLFFNWKAFDEPARFVAVAAVALSTLAGWYFLSEVTASRVVALIGVVTVIAPLLQVVAAHVREQTPFPIVEVQEPGSTVPSGRVEDALLLIVDGYPMDAVARTVFGHDTGPFSRALHEQGFTTPSVSWSHNTFTALGIPSILEGGQVADLTSDQVWRNQRSLYEITRGSSLSVKAFRTAGFKYVDVESGWDGDECWVADECVPSSLVNEALWTMLRPSPISEMMTTRWGSQLASGSFHTVEKLKHLEVFGDGVHHFVYAHLLLPHPPWVVDSQCNILPDPETEDNDPGRIADQLACVDRMVLDILSAIPKTTAVVISGDHGTGTRGQLFKTPDLWDDLDVAERLGAFLAYRLPNGCESPDRDTNVFAMRAMLECALTMGRPFNSAGYVLGGDVLSEVGVDRLDRIAASLLAAAG